MKKNLERIFTRQVIEMIDRDLKKEYPTLNVPTLAIIEKVFGCMGDIVNECLLRVSEDKKVRIELLNGFYYEASLQKGKKMISNLSGIEYDVPDKIKIKGYATENHLKEANEYYSDMRI